MNKKILLGISSSYCANFLKGQVRFLVDSGFEVIIISGPGEEIAILAKNESAKLFTIPFSKKFSVLKDLIHLFQIIKIIRDENPIIINAGNPKSGFLIMLAAYLLKRKNRIFTLHGLLSDTKSGLSRFIITTIERLSSSWSHKTLVVSNGLKQHAINRRIIKESKSLVLSNGSANGVDLNYFKKTDQLAHEAYNIKTKLNLSPNKLTIGFVGRVAKDKGVAFILAAFRALQKKMDLQLLIVGPLENSDPLTKEDMDFIYQCPDIFYIGKVLHMAPYYCLMDVLTLPSLREGLPNVLLEAAAMEVPVVVSNIPGIRDAVSVKNGIFVEPNTEDLLKALDIAVNDTAWRKSAAKYGRLHVEEYFENNKLWNAYLLFYNELIEG